MAQNAKIYMTEIKDCKNYNCGIPGKTRSKTSSLYLFNFHVIVAGRDMLIDMSKAETCRQNFESPIGLPHF